MVLKGASFLTAGILRSSGHCPEMGFFSGKNLLRSEYGIPTHDINRGCPLRLELSSQTKIILITHFLVQISSLEVQKIPCFWVPVLKWGFFRENISIRGWIFDGK